MSEANASIEENPTINLGAHVADEYGIQPPTARDMVRYGTVEIDGEKFDGDPERVPLAFVEGKTVKVVHETRTVQFTMRPPLEQRLG